MQNKERILHLDICDYSRKRLCPLYDNASNVSGQAADIFRTTERNGWKELTFTLPSVCHEETGIKPNYRLNYLKADFLIRVIDDDETDWFIISEPKITHNAYSKTFNVTAGHVSQLLKMKNLGLEFSDDAGNNVGTARELAETILDGTGWTVGYVYPFAEKNGDTKYRSLKASAKTGAFKLMAQMCDLFEAKPIYHGDNKTVDIVPINPFSEPAPGALPDLSLATEVVELHYGKNVSNVSRTLNTENIVTKLYAYGSYGDKTSGYCGIDECTHTEYVYMVSEDCPANQVYYFTFEDAAGVSITYHFTPQIDIPLGSRLMYSLLDPCSMMYIWDDSNQKAYPVTKGTVGTKLPALAAKHDDVQNWFQFVMNFDYYREVGLLTDDMIQIIADYQRTAPKLYQNIADASAQMSEAQTTLSETIGVIDFCKLDVDREEPLLGDGYSTLILNKSVYPDGVIYRTDYDRNKDNYFKWRVTESLNTDGDPINSAAGIVYILHDTNPVTWDKAYLKAIDDEGDSTALTLWANTGSLRIQDGDQFFLFSYNGINGHLGTLESNDESALMSLEAAVRVVTVDHPVIFTQDEPYVMSVNNVNGYGWLWRYYADANNFRVKPSDLYFAYVDEGDTGWKYVYFTDQNPGGAEAGAYWFDWRSSCLYRRKSSEWQLLDTAAERKIAELFATVYMFCKARDRYYQGLYEQYQYTVPEGSTLSAGNYFIENEYNSYWAFTTTEALGAGDTLTYNYDTAWVTQVRNGVESTLKPKGYRFDNVNYHPSNILEGKDIENGAIGVNDGSLSDSEEACRTQSFIAVVPSTLYAIQHAGRNLDIHFYDDNKNWLSCSASDATFTTPGGCSFIRIGASVSTSAFIEYNSVVISAVNSGNLIVIEDLNYTKLSSVVGDGEIIGLVHGFDKFLEYANLTYDTYYKELKAAQDAVLALEKEMTQAIGDLYREGWWQDASYVDGDEQKLYEDALDNLNHVAKPEAAYQINYLDLYESNMENQDYGAAEETVGVCWPDLSILAAIHLVDPEIAVNTWAFVDKLQKCYDKPWQTKIAINTNLSTIGQHSFSDVMTNIATVASEMKGKASYYDKTLGSAANNETVEQISAGVSKQEKELLSTMSRVESIGGTVITHSSQIKQTSDEISAEVKRATDKDNELSSQVKLTAAAITAEVKRATDAEGQLSTKVSQTADAITAEIKRANDAEGALATSIQANASGITAEVKRATDAEAAIAQTADGISSRVSTIEGSAIIKQTANEIQAIIKNNPNGANELNTSSVSVNKDGVSISTNGTFKVAATNDDESSAVTINSGGVAIGSTGTFTVQTDNFGVTPDGKISASNAVINGQISNNGYPVLTKNYDIYIGSSEPTSKHTGMIWIKPGVPSSGGGGSSGGSEEVIVPTNQTVTFTGTTDSSSRHWFYEDGSANVALTSGSYSAGSKASYNYNVVIPVYLARRSDGQKHGAKFKVSLNGSVTLTATKTWSSSESASNMTDTVSLSATSSVWLGNLSSITAVISISRESTGSYTGNIYLDRNQTVTATCS